MISCRMCKHGAGQHRQKIQGIKHATNALLVLFAIPSYLFQ